MASILLPLKERQLLLHGYVRNCNVNITLDLLGLCSLMYGDETFYWKIKGQDLQNILDPGHPILMTASLKSEIFIYRGIEFQLDIFKLFDTSTPNNHSIKLRCNLKSKNITMDTKLILCIEDIGLRVNVLCVDFGHRTWHDNTLRLSDIASNSKELNFLCKLDPLKIEPVNNNTNIKSFCKNIIFKQTSNIKWQLDDKMTPAYTSYNNNTVANWYESPEFHSGNFKVVLSNTENSIGVQLCIMSFPSNVDQIHAKWICILNYDGNIRKIQSYFIFARQNYADVSVHPITKSTFLDESTEFSLSLLSVNIKVFIVDIRDEFDQLVPWHLIRHWPQHNIINEKVSKSLSNGDTFKKKQQDMDEMKLMITDIKKELSDLSCFVKEKLSNVEVKYAIDINKETCEMIKIKEWLINAVKLPNYYELFVKNGFGSLDMIKEINNVTDLDYIGVNIKAHQLKLMNYITKKKKK
eukprot:508619_1